MGNWLSSKEPPAMPPAMVLVPPIFDFPPLAARTRMVVPAYDLLFGKLVLRCLFDDYFEDAKRFCTRIMLKPLEDPHVDMVATVSGPLDGKSNKNVEGNALFRWQRDLDDPLTFLDLFVSTSEPLRLRSCAYYPKYGFGAFGIFPFLMPKRVHPEDYGAMGFRYGSENLSVGTTFMPFPLSSQPPVSAWLVGRAGRLSVGVQYKPPYDSKYPMSLKDLKNWNCAIGYGLGSSSPLSPSFNLAIELVKSSQDLKNWNWAIGYGLSSSSPLSPSFNFSIELVKSQLIASFYQHVVVQRRVNNPFEENQVVGITNYIDFGFELATRVDGEKSMESVDESSFQIAASWQANKNFLVKGKIGPLTSSIALAFKSWWRPSFTFSITAVNDRLRGTKSYGFGIRAENIREASYQRADPNYVMLTPNREHLAAGVLRDFGKRPMFQSEVNSGNYDRLPRELKPIGKIF